MNVTRPFALCLAVAAPALAQTATHRTPVHRTEAVARCMTLPELSPKIPAVPAGSPCAKPLYTLTTVPAVRLDDVSPMEGSSLKETLGIESASFTLGYIDTKIGTGELAPPHKFYTIDYTGYLADGTKFDSSAGRGPISIPYGNHAVILGWDTGFAGMHVGGKRRLFIPYQLAYGAQGKPPIPPRAELIFDVELIKVSDTDPTPREPAPVPPPAKSPVNPPAQPAAPPAAATPPPANATTPKPQP